RRPLFPLQRNRRLDHRPPYAREVRRTQPSAPTGTQQRSLRPPRRVEPSGVRQQMRLRAERQGDRVREFGEVVDRGSTLTCATAQIFVTANQRWSKLTQAL